MKDKLPILIIAYNRPKSFLKILNAITPDICSRIYISIDGPKNLKDKEAVKKIEMYLKARTNLEIELKKSEQNQGCNVGVVSAIDWFFSNEKEGIILEDDCLPSKEYFEFVCKYRNILKSNSHIGMISGQMPFVSAKKTGKEFFITSYPMIHGWYTSASKWKLIRKNLYNTSRTNMRKSDSSLTINIARSNYWHALRLRVKYGGVDTWDCFVVNQFYLLNLKCITPPIEMVENIGNDNNGSHKVNLNLNIYREIDLGKYELDKYLEEQFYKIRILRVFTPYVKVILDMIMDISKASKQRKKFVRNQKHYL